MRPVNSPGLLLGRPIGMGPSLGYDQVLVRVDLQFFLPHITVAAAAYTINQNMFIRSLRAFPVMELGTWVIADVGNIQVLYHRQFLTLPYDILWQNNGLLAFKSFFLLHILVSKEIGRASCRERVT